jgi:hypothetical protein
MDFDRRRRARCRDWIEDSKAFGAAACTAYARARTAIETAPSGDPERSAAIANARRGLVTDLNTINARYELIDTLIFAADRVVICLAHRVSDVPWDADR